VSASAASWSRLDGPALFAHRGASREAPENSRPAFQRALALGADVLETDLHTSSDGQFVLSHDASGLRLAGINREIKDCTLAQLRNWSIGRKFREPDGQQAYAETRLLSLDEALTDFPDAVFNVDVKQCGFEDLPHLLALIAAKSAADRVLLTSFSGQTLKRIRALGYPGLTGMSRPEVALLALLPASINRLLGIRGRRVQVATRHLFKSFAEREYIDKSHNLGLCVDYWVINDTERAAHLLSLGADGIITDDPGSIAEVFAASPQTARWRERHGVKVEARSAITA
jgi:glycerophosphoryl diester phosphodiesterase